MPKKELPPSTGDAPSSVSPADGEADIIQKIAALWWVIRSLDADAGNTYAGH